jgi:hypothetical protein
LKEVNSQIEIHNKFGKNPPPERRNEIDGGLINKGLAV